MAQFGVHALIGLWIVWALPLFSPYILRFSFGAGLYLGCILPDMDIYAEAIGMFAHSDVHFHRTLTHSVITGLILLIFFAILEQFMNKKKLRPMYDIEASLDNDALLEITGALSTGSPDMNFQAFGTGLFAGILIHIMLDVVFWFSAIDLLFPLTTLGITSVVNVWTHGVDETTRIVLTLSESLCCALFFTALRQSVASKIGKWTQAYKPGDLNKRRQSFCDTDMEHSSMDFSIHAQDDICPLTQKSLKRAQTAMTYSRFIIVFQFIHFAAMCAAAVVIKDENTRSDVVFDGIYAELLIVCVPAYFYLSWALKDVILRKTDL